MFQTRWKYSKHFANVSTAWYSQRVHLVIPDKNNTRQVSATVLDRYPRDLSRYAQSGDMLHESYSESLHQQVLRLILKHLIYHTTHGDSVGIFVSVCANTLGTIL